MNYPSTQSAARAFISTHSLHRIAESALHRRESLVSTGLPANDVVLIKRREAAFTRAAGQVGPGFVGAQIGNKVIRRGEGRLPRGCGQQVTLKWRSMAAGHRHIARVKAEVPAHPAIAHEAIHEPERVELAPGHVGLADEFFRGMTNHLAFIALDPPARVFLQQQAIDARKHHHRESEPRRQIQHASPANAAPFAMRRFAKDFQQDVAIEFSEQRRFQTAWRITKVPLRQPLLQRTLGQMRQENLQEVAGLHAHHVVLQLLHFGERGMRQLAKPLDNSPLAIVGHRHRHQRRTANFVDVFVCRGNEAFRRIVDARQMVRFDAAAPVVGFIPGRHRHKAAVGRIAFGHPAAPLHANVALAIGEHPVQRRLWAALHDIHRVERCGAADKLQPCANRLRCAFAVANPIESQEIAGAGAIGIGFERALRVGIDAQRLRLARFALDDFVAQFEIAPFLAAAILPAAGAARTAIFDEKIDCVAFHVRNAPSQAVRAAYTEQRATGQCGAHYVIVAPAQHGLVPDGGQAVDFQMRIGRKQCVARGTAGGRDDPGIAARQARQVGDQFDGFVGKLTGDFHTSQKFQIHAIQVRREKLAHARVVDACLNEFHQQPFALLLTNGQSAIAEQVADQKHRLLIPRRRSKASGPHGQRTASFAKAIVHAFAIGSDIAESVVVKPANFFIEPQVQAGAAKEAIGFQEFGLIGNQLRRTAAGHGAREQHLSGTIECMQIAKAVERCPPGARHDVRHAVLIAKRLQPASGMFQRQALHEVGWRYVIGRRQGAAIRPRLAINPCGESMTLKRNFVGCECETATRMTKAAVISTAPARSAIFSTIMAEYSFITTWQLNQPVERVWGAINAAEDYPRWWPNILSYECLTPDNPRGVGAQGKRVVHGILPYSLEYVTTITKSDCPRELAFDAVGDLVGHGRFVFRPHRDGTEVIIYWDVTTQGRWLNRLSPLLKWLFAWNHNYVMQRGEKGLAAWLSTQ